MDKDIQDKVNAAIAAGAPKDEAIQRGQALQSQRASSPQNQDTPNIIGNGIAQSGILKGLFGIGNNPNVNNFVSGLIGGAVRPIEDLGNKTFGLENSLMDKLLGKKTQSTFDPAAANQTIPQQVGAVAGQLPKAAVTASLLGGAGQVPEIVKGAGLLARGANAALQGGIVGGAGGYGYSPAGQEIPYTAGGAALGAVANPLIQALTSGGLTFGGATKQMGKAYEQTPTTTSWSAMGSLAEKKLGNLTVGEQQAMDRIGARYAPASNGQPAINLVKPEGATVPTEADLMGGATTTMGEGSASKFIRDMRTTVNPAFKEVGGKTITALPTNATTATLSPTTPLSPQSSGAVGQNQINPTDVWNLRKKLDNEINWNAVTKGNVLPDEQKALIAYRGALNDWLDQIAPNATAYRNALSIYNKKLPLVGKGNVPTKALEFGAGALGLTRGAGLLRGILSGGNTGGQ